MATEGGYTNYVAYLDNSSSTQNPRVGHLNISESTIQPLSYASGTPLSTLYEVIEIGESQITSGGDILNLSSVKMLPPISGRDVLGVGKNYFEHAIEFNSSGYDSSDKVDQPTHPVIFTKRATSIIAHGEAIFPHPDFTQTADYEGEIGVIIGKSGFRIKEEDAMNHVWGYTIINDMTAREKQRDHKQFFIGKSPDTFCPMGPIAVPAYQLPKTLRVQTRVNGELRQDSTTDDLIFSIATLISTLSAGQTLQPGDVIATGTPAGVGFGQKPPVFLKPGDVIEISVTGLGILRNHIAEYTANNTTVERIANESCVPISNLNKTCGGIGLTRLNHKHLYYHHTGKPSGPSMLFIHGLGFSSTIFSPLVSKLQLEKTYSLHFLDLEGHGLSPTKATSVISIASYTADFTALIAHAKISETIVVAHGMGCLVALALAIQNPTIIHELILLSPPPSPLPQSARTALLADAESVRKSGMISILSGSASSGFEYEVAAVAMQMSLLSQDPEGYAKGCTALANSALERISVELLKARTLVLVCDQARQQEGIEDLHRMEGVTASGLPDAAYCLLLEDVTGLGLIVRKWLDRDYKDPTVVV